MSSVCFFLASVLLLFSNLSLAEVIDSGVYAMLGAAEGVEVALFALAAVMLFGAPRWCRFCGLREVAGSIWSMDWWYMCGFAVGVGRMW